MALTEEQKEIKKEYAKYKRKVTEIAAAIHDIVEETIWTDYGKLAVLSVDVETAMQDVIAFKEKHEFLR
ncbi:CCE_0567 family metalloprotein [Reinekea marinisedimentorum]|uniref:Rop-like protein n=1 Tax=Reinekea marinisedimentorum TaxID=230495 RepID=A0A4R3I288_9GAMM|nr:CCE_0567 family metalloprotein [Reinekea marinisedimentorum]TCS39738.1 Rop-like protein [Reinekea marinisedimentorum]